VARSAGNLGSDQALRIPRGARAQSAGSEAGGRLMSYDLMAPLMFGGLVAFLLLGYPVAFSLAANGLFFGFIGIEMGLLQPALLQALPERVLGIMANSTLLAIPFFTF